MFIPNCLRRWFGQSTPTRRTPQKLHCESLEAREVPAVVFASYADGTWAYNADTENWRQITTAQPVAMDESSDGQLFASYADGTWLYNYSTNGWAKLTASVAQVLSAPDQAGVVYGSFDTGTFRFKGNNWLKTTNTQATHLAAVDDNQFYGGFADGTWEWEGGVWGKLTNAKSIAMDAVSDGTLFASYADGTWKYDNGWSYFSGGVATIIDAVSDDEVYYTAATGTWYSDGGNTFKLTNHQASTLAYDPSALVATFSGLGGTWEHVSGLDWDKFANAKANKLAR